MPGLDVRQNIMSIFGEIPLSRVQKLILALVHFGLGAFLGLLPALIGFSCITIAPSANYWEIIGVLLLVFCLPPGVLFIILGLIGRGKIIFGVFRLLGRDVDTRFM